MKFAAPAFRKALPPPLLAFLAIFLATGTCSVVFSAAADRPLIKDFVGINIDFNFRPELYMRVCRLARNYHSINWDVKKPGDPITFPHCVNGVDWDQNAYSKWKKDHFEVDLCAQIEQFGPSLPEYETLWQNREDWCRDYGQQMAKYFGPAGPHKLVTSIEIGNEPGQKFNDLLFQKLFIAMARGIRAGDPKVRIVTPAVSASPADDWLKSLDQTFSSDEIKSLFDVINLHTYANVPEGAGQSPWDRSYPEDPNIDYLKRIDAAIKWRDEHAPEKQIWITEFGYDACTPEAMTHRPDWAAKLNWRGQTDLEQAQWLVRSLLCFATRRVDRAYVFIYNDNDQASVHAASGLTRNFTPKPSYYAVSQFQRKLGDYRFNRVVTHKSGELSVLEFKHAKDAGKLIWVVWSPTSTGAQRQQTLSDLPGTPMSAESMATTSAAPEKLSWQQVLGGIQLNVSENPLYVTFETH